MNIIEVYKKFPTQESCLAHLEKVRWNDIPACPYCNSTNATSFKKENRHHCNNCNTSYSVTVGTIFHKTKLDLQKWFLAISLIINAKKGISSRQLARDIEVNKDTAWYVGMRIRKAMVEEKSLLSGIVEVDEKYVGGKPRKGANKNSDTPNKRGRGTKKTPVVGMIERGGKVKAFVMQAGKGQLTSKRLKALVKENVDTEKTTVMTDEFKGYSGLSSIVTHKTIDHQKCYAIGDIHTNNVESFWAILQRGIIGQFHHLSVKHLPKYVNEFGFRFNNRKNESFFDLILSQALGVINV